MSRNRNAAFGGVQQPASNQSASTAPKPPSAEMDLDRLKRLPLGKYSARNCYTFLLDRIPWLSNVETSWRLSGQTLLSFAPSVFTSNLRLELNTLPFSVVCEIFDVIKEKVIADAAIQVAEGEEPAVNPQVASQWVSAPKSSFPAVRLDALMSPSDNFVQPQTPLTMPNYSAVVPGYQPSKKFAFGVPQIPFQSQAQVSSQYSLSAFPNSQPSQHGYPMQPAAMPSQHGTAAAPPLTLPQSDVTGAVSSGAFNSPPHTNIQQSSQHDRQVPGSNAFISAGIPPPPLSSQHATQLPSQHVQQLSSQHVQLPNSFSNQSNSSVNPFSFVNFQAQAKVLKPWEVAALQRAPRPQDTGLPPGSKRISMAATIAAA